MTGASALPLPHGRSADAAIAARTARTRRMLEAPIGPTLARLAAPNVLAMAVTAAVAIAEGAFAGRLGVNALAGLALVLPLVMLTQMLAAGAVGGAIASAVARSLGSDDAARAGRLAGAAWTIAVAAAIVSALLVGLFGQGLFDALGGGRALGDALDYIAVYLAGCAFVWLCHSTLAVIRGSGEMIVPSLILLLVALVSIPMMGALSLGWGPLPALGMAGLAAGQVAAHGIGTLAAIGYVLGGRAGVTASISGLRLELFADILRVGLVASLNTVLTVATIVVMVGFVGRFGPDALAGYGLGARLEFLMIPVVFGIGAALTAMVGANIGAGNRPRALRVAWIGGLAAAAIVGTVGMLFAADPNLWLLLYLGPEQQGALDAGRAYFRTVAPAYGFFALGLALYFASQGAGRMAWPVAASVLRMTVAVGGAVLLGRATSLGLHGVLLGIALGMVAYGVLTALAVRISGWR